MWLKRFQLDERVNRKVEELSRGNQQKVQFVVAVLHNPTVIVLDEPFSGLDPLNQEMMRDILLEMRERGKVIILSTHLMDQAERMSDHLCLIHKGRVILSGGLSEVKQEHGAEAVRIEFSGDGSFLTEIRGVKNVSLYPNSAEIELEDPSDANGLLSKIVDRLEVRRYEVVEPSLQTIFMKAIGEQKEQ